MITIEDVKDHLGIDYVDDMVIRNLERIIQVADKTLEGALGTGYPKDDPRAEELALVVCNDLYSNRELSGKVSGNVRRLIDDFQQQLRLEMRRGVHGSV